MKMIISLLLMISITVNGHTSNTPPSIKFTEHTKITSPGPGEGLLSMRLKDVRKVLGRKLTLKEKIAFKVLQWKLKKELKPFRADEKSKKGNAAMILGIISLVCLLIPFVIVLSLPAAIVAIVLGHSALRENPKDRQARTGIVLGWVTIAVLLIALAVLIVVLSSPHSWFG